MSTGIRVPAFRSSHEHGPSRPHQTVHTMTSYGAFLHLVENHSHALLMITIHTTQIQCPKRLKSVDFQLAPHHLDADRMCANTTAPCRPCAGELPHSKEIIDCVYVPKLHVLIVSSFGGPDGSTICLHDATTGKRYSVHR